MIGGVGDDDAGSDGAGEALCCHGGVGRLQPERLGGGTAGLVAPDSGLVRVAGMDVTRARARVRPLLGLAPQELALYPTATARENLFVFAGLYGLRRREARDRIGQLADALVL